MPYLRLLIDWQRVWLRISEMGLATLQRAKRYSRPINREYDSEWQPT